MPVRIRLATHPLARKKEPLYHIVVAKSKTGRQRKPLEVVGVYDPIPRYPTTSTGKVLDDQEKIKKISMNVDRVKYWLSVGAQPTDHCARLFEKADLIPKKPLYHLRSREPTERIPKILAGWGTPDQGVAISNPISTTLNPTETIKTTISSTGTPIESEIRTLSEKLVSTVLKESRWKETSVYPGTPHFHIPYVNAPVAVLETAYTEWMSSLSNDVKRQSPINVKRILSTPPFRFFMAYFQPLAHVDRSYNLARYYMLKQWLSLQTDAESKKMRRGDLFTVLKTLFGVWERCVIQLEGEGLWGETERKMRDDVRQRVRLLEIAEKDSAIKDKELNCWNRMWAMGKQSKKGKTVVKENVKGIESVKDMEDGKVSSTLEGEQVDVEKPATKEEI